MTGLTLTIEKNSVWRQEASSPPGWLGADQITPTGEIDIIHSETKCGISRNEKRETTQHDKKYETGYQ
jgi:hypothetical protein